MIDVTMMPFKVLEKKNYCKACQIDKYLSSKTPVKSCKHGF